MDLTQNREQSIQELRRAMGTLPSEAPSMRTEIRSLSDSLQVRLVSAPSSPHIAIFESAVATWGDDDYNLKWDRVSPENRFQVCLAALTGQTLPQAIEVVGYLFQVRGSPRWLFEEHAREMSQFTTYLSVGCRDNSKLDASIIGTVSAIDPNYFQLAKCNYAEILKDGTESWQSARAVLPMGYHHPYFYYTSLLSIMMNYRRFDRVRKDRPEMAALLDRSVEAVSKQSPLIAGCIRGNPPKETDFGSLDPKDIRLFSSQSF